MRHCQDDGGNSIHMGLPSWACDISLAGVVIFHRRGRRGRRRKREEVTAAG